MRMHEKFTFNQLGLHKEFYGKTTSSQNAPHPEEAHDFRLEWLPWQLLLDLHKSPGPPMPGMPAGSLGTHFQSSKVPFWFLAAQASPCPPCKFILFCGIVIRVFLCFIYRGEHMLYCFIFILYSIIIRLLVEPVSHHPHIIFQSTLLGTNRRQGTRYGA